MADLRRLGKRGSYRLGRLGGPPPAPPQPARPHHPSFRPPRRGPAAAWLAAGLVAAAVIAAAAGPGWWFLPFVIGVPAGVVSRWGRLRVRTALPAAALVAAAGRAVPLTWAAARGLPARGFARAVAAVAGLPARAGVILAVALLVAVLQVAAGLLLGRAATSRTGS